MSRPQKLIDDEAAMWVLAAGAAPAATAEALAEWFAEDPRHEAAYLKFLHEWESTGYLKVLKELFPERYPDLLRRLGIEDPLRGE